LSKEVNICGAKGTKESVHLNDLKAVGVIGILVSIVVGVVVIGVVVVCHKYSRID
jgi:hypothetical protein